MINDKIDEYPDIVSYKCLCDFEHNRLCEACFKFHVE